MVQITKERSILTNLKEHAKQDNSESREQKYEFVDQL